MLVSRQIPNSSKIFFPGWLRVDLEKTTHHFEKHLSLFCIHNTSSIIGVCTCSINTFCSGIKKRWFIIFSSSLWVYNRYSSLLSVGRLQLYYRGYANHVFLCYVCTAEGQDRVRMQTELFLTTVLIYVNLTLIVRSWLLTHAAWVAS